MSTTFKETFIIKGEELLKKIKELVEEGNVRKITIHDRTGKEIMSFPLTIRRSAGTCTGSCGSIGRFNWRMQHCSRKRKINFSWLFKKSPCMKKIIKSN